MARWLTLSPGAGPQPLPTGDLAAAANNGIGATTTAAMMDATATEQQMQQQQPTQMPAQMSAYLQSRTNSFEALADRSDGRGDARGAATSSQHGGHGRAHSMESDLVSHLIASSPPQGPFGDDLSNLLPPPMSPFDFANSHRSSLAAAANGLAKANSILTLPPVANTQQQTTTTYSMQQGTMPSLSGAAAQTMMPLQTQQQPLASPPPSLPTMMSLGHALVAPQQSVYRTISSDLETLRVLLAPPHTVELTVYTSDPRPLSVVLPEGTGTSFDFVRGTTVVVRNISQQAVIGMHVQTKQADLAQMMMPPQPQPAAQTTTQMQSTILDSMSLTQSQSTGQFAQQPQSQAMQHHLLPPQPYRQQTAPAPFVTEAALSLFMLGSGLNQQQPPPPPDRQTSFQRANSTLTKAPTPSTINELPMSGLSYGLLPPPIRQVTAPLPELKKHKKRLASTAMTNATVKTLPTYTSLTTAPTVADAERAPAAKKPRIFVEAQSKASVAPRPRSATPPGANQVAAKRRRALERQHRDLLAQMQADEEEATIANGGASSATSSASDGTQSSQSTPTLPARSSLSDSWTTQQIYHAASEAASATGTASNVVSPVTTALATLSPTINGRAVSQSDLPTDVALLCHLTTDANGAPIFACPRCPATYVSYRTYVTHLAVHAGRFSCTHCPRKFVDAYKLGRHQLTHTAEQLFACTLCDKRFKRKEDLRNHDRVHTGERPFKCTMCDKAFRRKDFLRGHMRWHTGEKPFACTVAGCDKKFVCTSHRRNHIRRHTGEKPYACTVCSQRFVSASSLKAHSYVHCTERNFVCTYAGCDKRYPVASRLLRHTRKHEAVAAAAAAGGMQLHMGGMSCGTATSHTHLSVGGAQSAFAMAAAIIDTDEEELDEDDEDVDEDEEDA